MKVCTLFTGLFLLIGVSLFGQTERYKFRQLSINEGLSHNQVNAIHKDRKGFVWISTSAGLNRFDGHDVKIFRRDPRDTTTLPSNNVSRILGAPDGKLAIQTSDGLAIYDPATESFSRNSAAFFRKWGLPEGTLLDIKSDGDSIAWFVMSDALVLYRQDRKSTEIFRHAFQDTTSIEPQPVTSFVVAQPGYYWLAHGNGTIEKVVLTNSGPKVVYRNDWLAKRNNHASYDYKLASDRDGDLWVWLNNDNQGAYFFNTKTGQFTRYTTASDPMRLSANIVTGIVQDNSGMIWVGTDHGGVNIIDKKNNTVRHVYHLEDEPASLAQNSVNTLYRDESGIVWAGTYKSGVSYYHESIFRFTLFRHSSNDPDGLPYSDVNRFAEDRSGNLWIGTNGGGLIRFDRRTGKFIQYRNDPRNANSLSSDVIVSLWVDHTDALWIGTYYGGLNRFDGKTFRRYQHVPDDPTSIPGRSVWEIFEDSHQNLWIGTLEGGLAKYDRKTNSFDRFRHANGSITSSPYISAVAEDRNGNIWIGTDAGIDVYTPQSGTTKHYQYIAGDPSSLNSNVVYDVLEDSRGRIWVATQEGLNLFNPDTKTFQTLAENDIPRNSPVLTLEEDLQGHIWLGSLQGLISMALFDNDSVTVSHYTPEDGLQSMQFNENASLRTRRGELIFGGPRGFNVFDPAEVKDIQGKNTLVFTDFQLFQKSIEIGENVKGRTILKRSISETNEIVLPPGQNFFSIEFSALNFLQPDKNEYWYKLEGLHAEWLPIDKETRKITFTNISPGDYTLRVIAVQGQGVPDVEASLKIEVLPPFYKSNLAFVLYLVLLLAILYFARRLIQQREKLKFAIEHERQEAMRMHELDMMKIRFFTNVSHEFRTPLTLILTPVERILKQMSGSENVQTFQLIHRNAKRLLTLVNQLLDFRKMEVQEIRFSPSEGDIIAFIRETVLSFSDLSEKKGIQLTFSADAPSLETIFDQDKLEKILFNLLSNAFKFTPDRGKVSVTVSLEDRSGTNWVIIRVSDTGIGIPEDKLERIFDRFFQHDLPRTMTNQGSGIGLSITHEFVRISNGEIKTESKVGEGSKFTVGLPAPEIAGPTRAVSAAPVPVEITHAPAPAEDEGKTPLSEHSLLLIEDNDDFRFYLKDNLKFAYRIYEAATGEAGWDLCLKVQPDLIVSDVMMPGMNGIELCRKIKSDERVSHIPVILLTARNTEEQRLEGFETGADDYITKPFSFEILESRIRNLIALRARAQKNFRKTLEVKASELNITPLDTRFIENAVKCVEEHVASPDFTVEDLGRELGFSRAYLYKKIVALTGKSPLEFIRHIRLQHAAQLLEKSQMTVAEVAYQVGFNNPKYFARYFKEEFKILPSAYAASRRNAKPK